MGFYYKKGILETSVPWVKPTQKLFSAWLADFLKIDGANKYNVWLCGGFLQDKWETWDIDIVIHGPRDLELLERVLIDGHYIGLYKYNLLLDIQYHYKNLAWPFKQAQKVSKIVMYDKIIKNNETILDLRLNKSLKQLSRNLWKITKTEPSEKQLRRINEGLAYVNAPRLLFSPK